MRIDVAVFGLLLALGVVGEALAWFDPFDVQAGLECRQYGAANKRPVRFKPWDGCYERVGGEWRKVGL